MVTGYCGDERKKACPEGAQAGIFGRCYFAAAILDAGCMVFETTL